MSKAYFHSIKMTLKTVCQMINNFLFLDYRPMDTSLTVNMTGNDTIIVNTIIDLLCSAKADPPAKYRFYKGLESLFNTTLESNAATFTTLVRERKSRVKFRCTPFNDFGEGPTRTINLTVRCKYRPVIIILYLT